MDGEFGDEGLEVVQQMRRHLVLIEVEVAQPATPRQRRQIANARHLSNGEVFEAREILEPAHALLVDVAAVEVQPLQPRERLPLLARRRHGSRTVIIVVVVAFIIVVVVGFGHDDPRCRRWCSLLLLVAIVGQRSTAADGADVITARHWCEAVGVRPGEDSAVGEGGVGHIELAQVAGQREVGPLGPSDGAACEAERAQVRERLDDLQLREGRQVQVELHQAPQLPQLRVVLAPRPGETEALEGGESGGRRH